MAFIDPETLRRYPSIGIVLGVATAAFVVYLLGLGRDEMEVLRRLRAPEAESVHEAVTRGGVRWVTVSGGRWDCDGTITRERRGLIERTLFGRVASMEVPIHGEGPDDLLVARFEDGTPCADRPQSALTGIMGSVEVFTSRDALARWRPMARRVAVLNVGAGPAAAMRLFVAVAGVGLCGLACAGYYARVLFKRERRAPSRSWKDPIEPS